MTESDENESYRQFRFRLPPGATDILLVRHGESAPARLDAPAPRVDGRSDPALDPQGRKEADLVAERLQHEDVAAIYVSSLRRTHETAAPLAAPGDAGRPVVSRSSAALGSMVGWRS